MGFEAAGSCCGKRDDDDNRFALVEVGIVTGSASAGASTAANVRPRVLFRAGARLIATDSGRESFVLSPPPPCRATSAAEVCGVHVTAVDDGAAADTEEEDDDDEEVVVAPDGLGNKSAARGGGRGRPRVLFPAAMCPVRAGLFPGMVLLSLPS